MAADRKALLIVFLTVMIDLLGFGIVLPLLARFARALEAGPWQMGLLLASFSAMQFIFNPLWGRWSDVIGRRPVILVGLAGSVLFYALFAYASLIGSLTWMFVARLGAGIAGGTISTAQAYISDVTDKKGRTAGMALIGAAFGVGFTLGPIIGALSLHLDGIWSLDFLLAEASAGAVRLSPWPGMVAAWISLFALLLAVYRLPETRWNRVADGGTTTVPIPEENANDFPHAKTPAHQHRGWLNSQALQAARQTPMVPSLMAVFFTATLAFAIFEVTVALLTKDAFHLGNRGNSYFFAYLGLCLAVAQGVVVRRMSKKVENRTMALMGTLAMVVGLVGLAGAAILENVIFGFLVTPILVAGFAGMTTSLQAMISNATDDDHQGVVLGLNQSWSALARIVGPIVGFILFAQHITLPYFIPAGILLAVSLILWKIPASPLGTDPIAEDKTTE